MVERLKMPGSYEHQGIGINVNEKIQLTRFSVVNAVWEAMAIL